MNYSIFNRKTKEYVVVTSVNAATRFLFKDWNDYVVNVNNISRAMDEVQTSADIYEDDHIFIILTNEPVNFW